MKLRALWGVVLIIVASMMPLTSQAAPEDNSPLSIVVSPALLTLSGKPGQTVTQDIRVKNNSSRNENLKVELLKFGPGGEEGQAEIAEFAATDISKNWVRFDRNAFIATPNVWSTIRMSITIPRDAGFGYYYVVKFSRKVENSSLEGRSSVIGGASVLILLAVDRPGAKREAQIASISSDHNVYEFLPATIRIKVRNTGNVHFAPSGSVFMSQGKKQLATVPINESGGNVLPGSVRVFTATWDQGWPVYKTVMDGDRAAVDGKGQPKKALDWNGLKFSDIRFGRFTADATMVYTDARRRDVPVEGRVSFWVTPWRILAVVLFVGALMTFGLYSMVRRFLPKKRRRT